MTDDSDAGRLSDNHRAEFRRLAGVAVPQDADGDAAIDELLRDLGGHPEAIRLAALATRTRPLSAIVDAVRSENGPSGTLEPLVGLGREAFDAAEGDTRRAWIALAIFSGRFDLAQATVVLTACGVVRPEEILGHLIDRGVVLRLSSSDRLQFMVPALYRAPARGASGAAVEVRKSAWSGLKNWWRDAAERASRNWFGSGQQVLFREIEERLDSLGPLKAGASPEERGEVMEIVALLEPFWSSSSRVEFAIGLLEELVKTGQSSPRQRFVALWTLAWLTISYDLDRADAWLTEATGLLPEVGDRIPEARARLDRVGGLIDLYRGDAAAARALFGRALSYDSSTDDDGQTYFDLSFLASAASLEGDQRVAYDLCERAIALCDRRGEIWLKNYTQWAFALTAWRGGDRHRAYVLALDGIESAAAINDAYSGAMCLEIAAWYEVGDGNSRVAARVLGVADALRVTVRLPTLLWGAKELHDAAVRDAIAALGPAQFWKSFRGVGGSGIRDALGWLQPDPPVAHADLQGAPAAATLTPRQREIAVLIAEGRSNKEIARLLLITVRTVETHIEHMFAKLGVGSRAQIAAWSVRHLARSM